MTALYIIGAIVAVILLLLFLPLVRLRIDVGEKVSVYLRAAGIKIMLFPQKKKPKKAKKAKQEQKTAKGETPQEKGGLSLSADDIPYILQTVTELVSDIIYAISRKLTVRIIKFYVNICTDDAAKTALIYGAASAAANALVGFLDENGKLSVKRTPQILCDFTGEKTVVDIKLAFILSLAGALAIFKPVILWAANMRLAAKNKKDDQNQIGQSSGKV
ncbi:MAG: hypothetical protein IJR55_00085 [Clostridia bacterium]|nr:hypothetical protein [Clostridia bacterium]